LITLAPVFTTSGPIATTFPIATTTPIAITKEPETIVTKAAPSIATTMEPPAPTFGTMRGRGDGGFTMRKPDERHHVRCCAGVQNDWSARVQMNYYGGCSKKQTYTDAESYCKRKTWRGQPLNLCTKDQIKSQRTKGTGCGFDNQQIWVSATPNGSAPSRLLEYQPFLAPRPSSEPSE